jgi:hypothetical protein
VLKIIIQSIFFVALVLFIGPSCAGGLQIGIGSAALPNDPKPSSSSLILQAQFNGINGKTVNGNALIYYINGYYLVRLEGMTIPEETGLRVQVFATPSGQVANLPLRAFSGNQNYTISGAPSSVTIRSVYIFSTQNNINYGSALFP